MSPHEWIPYAVAFANAASVFGWSREIVERQHERDEDCTWTEAVWLDRKDRFLFCEGDVTAALAEELIRIAGLVK